MNHDRNPWLPLAPRSTDARMRLFCLPYAGGGSTIYRSWPAAVPPALQICAVQLPGRENRLMERPFTKMSELMPALVEAIRAHLDRPFAIFGHSMGALAGFELARALRRAGLRQPQHLILSAHRAPHLPDRRPHIHALPSAAFWGELQRLEGTPQEVLDHEELKELIEPALRADFELCEVYSPAKEEPFDAPMTVFGGTEDPNVDEEELAAWRPYTNGAFRTRMFPGHHLFVQTRNPEVVTEVLRDLRPSLS